MTNLLDIEGIGPKYAATLADAGLTTTQDLIDSAGSATGRKTLAEKTGLTTHQLLEWVNRADLMRVKGVGEEYSDLLEAAGVDSPTELATRRADNLHAKIVEVNDAKKLVRRVPSQQEIADWIADAKALPKVVTH